VPAIRLDSIDIFRALTMFLMIFVNDLWTLKGVPWWLEHSKGPDDAMGVSDVVFPCFLFIVGLSIPFAIANRQAKGETSFLTVFHILERTFALLLMGIFTVNLESALVQGMEVSKYVWSLFMVLAFFLIWNTYPRNGQLKYSSLKLVGFIILAGLAVIYKGGDPDHPRGMGTLWYGILGLIGWSYLICALIYFLVGDSLPGVVAGWLFLVVFNLADFSGYLDFLDPVREYVWIVGSGSMPSFTMAGITASVVYRKYVDKESNGYIYLLILAMLGAVCFLYGVGTRPFWGISKIRATPSWIGLCSGISFISFAFLFWLVDMKKLKNWASVLRPAGTATLTCYLVPYVWYAIITLLGISLPMYLRTGLIGLLKSACFALLVIVVTGLLNRLGIKLKI
jgi:predicted acyltransferase